MNCFEKLKNFLSKRVIFWFLIFVFVNVIANIPSSNHLTEILSHFKLHYFYTCIVFIAAFIYLVFFNKRFIIGILLSAIIMMINFIDLSPYFIREKITQPEHTIKLGLFNVLTSNWHFSSALKEIKENNPDIVIMQEVDDNWIDELGFLRKNYPYYVEYPMNIGNFGIAMYSKFPVEKIMDIEFWSDFKLPVATAQLNINDRKVNIYAVHTTPPLRKDYFEVRNDMFKKMNEIIKTHPNNLIIAGDFNSTAFSPSYKKYIKSTNINDAQTIAGNIHIGSWNTMHPSILRITVEHVLSSKDIKPVSYKQGKFFGSDHFPVFVEFEL